SNQSADPLQHLVNIDGCQAKRLVGAEHPVHKITQPVGLFNDDAGVVMQVVVHQLPVEQLCRTTDAAQRVLDLMGKTSDQHAGGFLVGQQVLFAADAQQAVTGLHFNQQAAVVLAADRGYGVIQSDSAALVQDELRLP